MALTNQGISSGTSLKMAAPESSCYAKLLMLHIIKTFFFRHREGKVSAADTSYVFADHHEEREGDNVLGLNVTITFRKQQVYYANNTVEQYIIS